MFPHPSKLLAANTTLRNGCGKSCHGLAFLAYSVITSRDAQDLPDGRLPRPRHLSPTSACQNSIHPQMTLVFESFLSPPITILFPFCIFLIILIHASFLCQFVSTSVPPLPAECKHFEGKHWSSSFLHSTPRLFASSRCLDHTC